MIPEMERRLASFVDRAKEMSRFSQMVDEMKDQPEKLIMTIWGEAGLGKTSLFYRMVHECALRNLRKAEVVWTDTRNHDYLAIMSKIRDDAGVACFQSFTDLANSPFSAPIEIKVSMGTDASVNLANNLNATNAQIGDISVIKAEQFVVPLSSMAMPDLASIEKNRMNRLTDLFRQNLAQAVEKEPLVIFFDAIEKMTDTTYMWVRDELLKPISAGDLKNVCFVLFGRQKLKFDSFMQMVIEDTQLQPLGHADIVEYLQKRCLAEKLESVDEQTRNGIANVILQFTEGRPDDVANQVEVFIRGCKKGSM